MAIRAEQAVKLRHPAARIWQSEPSSDETVTSGGSDLAIRAEQAVKLPARIWQSEPSRDEFGLPDPAAWNLDC
ncbi:hypothetical protein QUF72_20680 [Desulfobacterales bacterium HSG2]|nr:hypothetical protein [Desulfobacterales bacterium HSG2]